MGFSVADVEWYEAFSGYTLGVIVSCRYNEPGTERLGHNRNNSNYTRHMAEIMGIEMPKDVIVYPG